jgi:hypothetical protein
LHYSERGQAKALFVSEGFAEVKDNTLRVVCEAGELPHEKLSLPLDQLLLHLLNGWPSDASGGEEENRERAFHHRDGTVEEIRGGETLRHDVAGFHQF